MRRGWWPLIGLAVGATGGALWGWFGSGGYEALDSMLGTAFLGALAGLLVGALATRAGHRRER